MPLLCNLVKNKFAFVYEKNFKKCLPKFKKKTFVARGGGEGLEKT